MSKRDERSEKQLAIKAEIHRAFKSYCLDKQEYMIDLASKILVTEMVKDGYKLNFPPDKYGVKLGYIS